MKEKEVLGRLCIAGLEARGLGKDERYRNRLRREMKAVDQQGDHEYFIKLYNKFREQKLVFPRNENNLLIAWLLDLASDFDIDQEPVTVMGEMPDIDVDYIKDVRDYLKREWAPTTFGREYICEIGTYGTSGIKGSLLDMTRVHGLDVHEAQNITVKIKDKFADDEGNTQELKWDDALKIYGDLKDFCEKHPEVAQAARMLQDRNRTGGVHAGGLIISSVPIDGFVPLEVRMVNKDNPDGVICSAWTEGLNAQDLQPVGLIKFDLLVINNLLQIAIACDLIKRRYGLSNICAVPGGWDWSDISYLNDPQSLKMADDADLKCIFQFDSEGIRKMVKRGGVSSFDDLAAYSALYRPGPLNMGMDARYCKRKRGEEPWNVHPLLQPILGRTYGVMIFQEQVMDMLRVVGNVPDMHTEKVRKAISKKKVAQFIKYKEMFVENGKRNLGVNAEFCLDLWDQIESFAEYGFNKSVDQCTLIPYPGGTREIKDFHPGDTVFCVNEAGKTVETEVVAVHDHGELNAFEVIFDDGSTVVCSIDHKFLTEKGQMPLREICRTHSPIYVDQHIGEIYGKCKEGRLESQMWQSGENQKVDGTTSQRVSQVQGVILGQCNSRSTLRREVQDVERSRGSFQVLPQVQSNQTREYTSQDGEVEQRQRRSCQKEDILGRRQENFCQTRDTGSTCGQSQEMARRESRQVCEMYGGCLEEFQTVSDGGMASRTVVGMGYETNSLWRDKETSRFREGEYLDRSGWVLSFLQSGLQKPSTEITSCPATGRDIEERGVASERRDVDPSGYDLFQEQFGGDAGGVVRVVAGHAPVTDTGCLASRRIVRVCYVGKRRMCDLEVANPTHNFLLPNGVITSNSHAYAYTYVSARLLYLKAHYPLEFYTAILMCEKDDAKFREYKLDAKYHGVMVNPVHINKSKENFHIEDGQIYFGFSNIKSIGDAVAKRIVENQPYRDFPDFLNRFGTDATPIKALTALGVFEEKYDRVTLRKFAEFYKDGAKKRRDRQVRFQTAQDKKFEELRELLLSEVSESDPDFEAMCNFNDEAEAKWEERFSHVMRSVEYKSKGEIKTKEVSLAKMLQDVAKKRATSLKNFEEKESDDDEAPITLDQFNPSMIKLNDDELEILNDELEVNGEITYPKAESKYYGFQWTHVLETCIGYQGLTIDDLLNEGIACGPIEVEIKQVKERMSKPKSPDKPGTQFWSIEVEDANARRMFVNIWKEDFTRWQQELVVGNLVCMRVRPPSGGFNTMTFESFSRMEKGKKPPTKEEDYRLVVLQRPEKPVKKEEIDLGDFQFDASAVEGLDL